MVLSFFSQWLGRDAEKTASLGEGGHWCWGGSDRAATFVVEGVCKLGLYHFSANFIGLSEKASEKLSKISKRLDKEDGLD